MDLHLHCFSTARSGHHAIIYWLSGCASQDIQKFYYSNLVKMGVDPLVAHKLGQNDPHSKTRLIPTMANIAPKDVEVLFGSSEDYYSNAWKYLYTFPDITTFKFAVTRDPFNQFASRLQLFHSKGKSWQLDFNTFVLDFPTLWADNSNYLLNESDQVLDIDYNLWFVGRGYRETVCSLFPIELGAKYNEDFLNFVPIQGGGSSFDEKRFNGKAQEMKALTRWENYKDDKDFWEILLGGGPRFIDSIISRYFDCADSYRFDYLTEPLEMLTKYSLKNL